MNNDEALRKIRALSEIMHEQGRDLVGMLRYALLFVEENEGYAPDDSMAKGDARLYEIVSDIKKSMDRDYANHGDGSL